MDDIEAELQQHAVREVTSNEIGEAVLQNLQALNEVAYVRFASVYRQFRGVRDFIDELNHLKNCISQAESDPKLTERALESFSADLGLPSDPVLITRSTSS